jgi:hypothetical protein
VALCLDLATPRFNNLASSILSHPARRVFCWKTICVIRPCAALSRSTSHITHGERSERDRPNRCWLPPHPMNPHSVPLWVRSTLPVQRLASSLPLGLKPIGNGKETHSNTRYLDGWTKPLRNRTIATHAGQETTVRSMSLAIRHGSPLGIYRMFSYVQSQ